MTGSGCWLLIETFTWPRHVLLNIVARFQDQASWERTRWKLYNLYGWVPKVTQHFHHIHKSPPKFKERKCRPSWLWTAVCTVMVNFMCQRDWVTWCPDIILSESVRVFLGEISIWICRLSKADCPPYCGGASSDQVKTWTEQKGWVWGNSCLTELGHLVFSGLWIQVKTLAFLGSWARWLSDWNLYHYYSWFSGLWAWTGTTHRLFRVSVLLTADFGAYQPP